MQKSKWIIKTKKNY